MPEVYYFLFCLFISFLKFNKNEKIFDGESLIVIKTSLQIDLHTEICPDLFYEGLNKF